MAITDKFASNKDQQLIRAARDGKLREVCHLWHKEADVNAADEGGSTALMCASVNGHANIAAILLQQDEIDVNHVNKYGDTALL